MFTRVLASILAFSSSLFGQSINSKDLSKIFPKFETFVIQGMEESNVPGVAIAIVHNNEVVFLKGFGYSNLEGKNIVTPDTIFQLASVSKPITSSVLAGLVERGDIEWDSKIQNLDPNFLLAIPWVSANLTIRDLLSHRSGLPDHAGDILEDLGYDLPLILHQLRFVALNPFRAHYAYTNFGYSEAAYATSLLVKKTWNALAEEILFRPLGMTSTSFSFQDYYHHPDKATTYQIIEGKSVPLSPPRDPDAQSPAGGVSSSARDMAKWMILQLGGYQDKKIISQDFLNQTHQPVILTQINQETGQPIFYGMGWNVSYEEGQRRLSHSGAFTMGVRSEVSLLPDEKLGIIILTNASPSALPEALTKTFYDLIFKGEVEKNLVAKYNQKWLENVVEPQMHYEVSKESFTSALPVNKYIGEFHNDYYGTIKIERKGTGLQLVIGPQKKIFPLQHLTRDVFVFTTQGENAIGETQVIYSLDESGQVRQLAIDYLNKFGMGTFTPLNK